jgi:mannosyltransferase
VLALWPALDNLYHNPTYARDDYRGIARMIEADAQYGDAVLLNAPNQWEVFTYYHRGGAPSIPLLYKPQGESAVNAQLTDIAAQYRRLFVLYYAERESDPNALYERWLARNAYKSDEQWVGNIRMAVYGTRAPSMTQAYQASFGTLITLTSAVVSTQQVQVGDVLTLRLTLHADHPMTQRYKMFVHLGAAESAPVAQNDAESVAGFRPTTTWNAGETITDQRGVWIKPGTPVGVYGLYVGLYDSANGQRLLLADGTDRLRLGEVSVVP